MKLRTLNFFLFFSFFIQLFAVVPPHYYDAAEGTKERVLKTSLYTIIHEATVLKYGGSGDNYTWAGFYQTDRLEDNVVLDRYSTIVRNFNGNGSVSGMHIEHSFANSWWGKIQNQAYKDLHHLYPADGSTNIRKSNHPIGIVQGEPTSDSGLVKIGKSALRPGDSITVWEPADQYKGDFARTYMYMVTCYEDYANLWQGDGLLLLDNNTYPVFEDWVINLLLEWNANDPVDELERTRNDKVYTIQGNRNPFIDYPELANHIWGVDKDTPFYTEAAATTPQLFMPQDNEVVDLRVQPLSVDGSYTMTIRGRNITGDITITSSNPVFVPAVSTVSAADAIIGKNVEIAAHWTATGDVSTIITLSYNDKTTQFTLKANVWDGIPAYPATAISSSKYSKKFTANWMLLPSITEVSLNVYTKQGEEQHALDTYPMVVSGSEYIVHVPTASTTYYYTVSSGDLVSNEVEVVMPAIDPIFSVSKTDYYFTAIPTVASAEQAIAVSAEGLKDNTVNVETTTPFEISTDKENWSTKLVLTDINPTFYLRMGAVATNGEVEGEVVLTGLEIEKEIILSAYGTVDASKAFFENFEGDTKSSYAAAEVFLSSGKWMLSEALLGKLDNDKKNGSQSVRLRNNGSGEDKVFGSIEMLEDKPLGVNTLSFYAGSYGKDATGTIEVYYSIDQGASWTLAPGGSITVTKTWEKYELPLNISEPLRLRIQKNDTGSTSTRRVSLDDITMNNFSASGIDLNSLNKSVVTATKGTLFVSLSQASDLQLYTLQGQLVRTYVLSAGEHRLSLTTGTYLVRVGGISKVVYL